jgi:hypothetical protein
MILNRSDIIWFSKIKTMSFSLQMNATNFVLVVFSMILFTTYFRTIRKLLPFKLKLLAGIWKNFQFIPLQKVSSLFPFSLVLS